MDIGSHLLIGASVAIVSHASPTQAGLIIAFSLLPDISQIPEYLYLGYLRHRKFDLPFNRDWKHIRFHHPFFSALWDIPHSLLFVAFVLYPYFRYYNWPVILLLPYVLHIFFDLFTHKGEWAVKPFYPIPYKFQGLTNAWAWPITSMLASWGVLACLIATVYFLR